MSYIRFRNRVDCVPRIRLEKMGISSKRDNESTVGQFGSGAKLAPVAAIRKGFEWICLGSDDRGDYRLDYVTKDVDGYDIVYYRYTTEEGITDIPSSFSLDAGVISWDTDFQIYREAFANALDANLEFGADYSVEIVDSIERKDGYFDVYLTADPDLLEFFDNSDLYFKHDNQPDFISKAAGGSDIGLYKNYVIEDSVRQCISHVSDGKLYGKGGIWIGDTPDPCSIFSYQHSGFRLNEERRIADAYQVDSIASYALRNLSDKNAIRDIFMLDKSSEYDSCVEWCLASYHFDNMKSDAAWAEVWVEQYGETCIPICPAGVEGHYSEELTIQLQMRGLTVREVDNYVVYRLIVNSPSEVELNVSNILGTRAEFDIVDELTYVRQATLTKALSVVGRFETISDDIEFVAFTPRGHQETIHGVWVSEDRKIMLSVRALDLGVEHMVATIVHELDHATTGYGDTDRHFRDIADRRIGRLMMLLAEVDGL